MTYYYDCQYDKDDPKFKDKHANKYQENKALFDRLNLTRDVEVRLGHLVISDKQDRQKGADMLLAIDMLTKAYDRHYDVAILMAGDRDFIPLIQTVKNLTGKSVYGVVFEGCPQDVIKVFNDVLIIDSKNRGMIRSEKWP